MSFYESDEQLSQYLHFHYGAEYFGVANYPGACVRYCIEQCTGAPASTALDLGCAVGRSAFELARHVPKVTGIDLSDRFIGTARQLARGETLTNAIREQGELQRIETISLAALDLQHNAGRVEFLQGDACDLSLGGTGHDLVFAGNLLDRLPDPARFLAGLAERVRPGGLLVLSSPYTLLEQFTAREKWIGGFMQGDKPVDMTDALRRHLSPQFTEAVAPINLPFVIRETARKFQHSVAEVTVWRRH